MRTLNQNRFKIVNPTHPLLKIAMLALSLYACPAISFADSDLAPLTLENKGNTSPYSVLGLSPGDPYSITQEKLSGHFDKPLADEIVTLSVRNSKGREFRYEYAQRMISPWVTPFVRMGHEPYEEVNLSLATDVLEGRVLGIHRTIVETDNDRPSAEAVFTQVKEAFGVPSYEQLGGFTSHLLYLHGPDGFISDLGALDAQIVAASGQGNLRSSIGVAGGQFDKETPCISTIGQPAIYQFKSTRTHDPLAGCDLVFHVAVQSGSEKTTISFDLVDYALVRLNRDETDRQILEALEQPQTKSKIKL